MSKNLKAREFTFDTAQLDMEFDVEATVEDVEEYLVEDLEVPQEYISSLNINDAYIKLELDPSKRYFNDDWYVNLQRVG